MSEPAFPSVNGTWGNDGMSLRDYFAGQAMIAMVAHPVNIAEESYRIADAMLEARNLKHND